MCEVCDKTHEVIAPTKTGFIKVSCPICGPKPMELVNKDWENFCNRFEEALQQHEQNGVEHHAYVHSS